MMSRRRVLAATGAALVMPAAAVAQDGFHVPSEDRAHEMTLMQWPASRKVHPDPVFLRMLQATVIRVANTLSEFEPVVLLAEASYHAVLKARLASSVTLWDIPTEDLWARDAGPIIVIDGTGGRAVRHIRFNGWGNRQLHRHDGRIAERVADRLGLPMLATDLRGEAGGVEQDGHGLLIAHESSWVNDNRNPGMPRDAVEQALLSAYGAEQMIWAPGVAGEDITDYHIDSLARFSGPGRVLINLPDNPDWSDPFHQAAFQTHDILKDQGLEIEVIPEPGTRRVHSVDFVASYANYYVCNGGVIAPQFGDPETDAIARDALMRHYPGREIVMLNTDPIGEVGGGIHCATHQVPVA